MTGRPAAIGALWFGIQVVWGAILGVSLQARSSALGVDDPVAAYALIASIGAALAALTQVAVGFISDARRVRIGHRRDLYLSGIAIALPALIAFYLAPTYPILLATFIALQIGMNVLGGPYQAAVPDHVPPERRGAASAWMSGYQFFGQCTGLLIVSFSRDAVAGFAIAGALALSFAVTFTHLVRMPEAMAPAPHLRIDRDFRTLLVSRGLINLGFYTFVGYLFFFVRDTLHPADPRTMTGILFLAFTIAGVLGAALSGRPSDRIDKRIVVSVSGLAIAATIGALAGASSLPTILIAGTLAGVAWGAFFTADWAIAYVVLPTDAMAAAMGVWNLAAALPQIIAPLLGAAVFAAFGIRATLVMVILEFALGTLWLWRLPPLTVRVAR
jgi:MFS family permease